MKKLRVCLDYGHGGRDPGAVHASRRESDDNLRLGRALARSLRKKGVQVVETRQEDRSVSLWERVALSNRKACDYFISLHRNAFRPEEARGVESYTHPQASWRAKDLARRIQSSLVGLGFRNRGLKSASFYVLRRTKAPAILLELGFIDSREDNRIFDKCFWEIVEVISREISL